MNKALLFTYVFLSLTFFTSTSYTQTVGLGFTANSLSMGINVNYSLSEHNKWKNVIGVRIMVNTFDMKLRPYNSAMDGYAWKFYEHFSLNYRINRTFYNYKNLSIGGMVNFHVSYHGLLNRDYDDIYNPNTGEYEVKEDILRHKPSLAFEITLGPMLSYQLSEKLIINGAMGIGVGTATYSYLPKDYYSIKTGIRQQRFLIDPIWTNLPLTHFLNQLYVVGIEIPWWSIGVKYRLK